jgi:UDP-N-acetylmuramate--alanine ligase
MKGRSDNLTTEGLLTQDRLEFANRELMFGKIRKLYFVGIGGAGMSGIAEILHNLGFEIRGSDVSTSEITDYLAELGITIHDGHRAANLGDAEVLVISSAVGEDNPEVVEARRQGIPVIKRAEMLGELMRLKYSIGIAGTHGKTTTTSMIGLIMQHAKLQPTIIVGGVVAGLGTGAALGSGEYLVAEADEYDRSFLAMFPSLAVITNLEPDHLDCYADMDDLAQSFVTYMNRVPFYGGVVIPADDQHISRIRHQIARPYCTFGFDTGADYRAVTVDMQPGRSVFSVYHRGDLLGEIILHVPGLHNVANALAAVAACHHLGVPFVQIADGLLSYQGVERRFEIIGEADDIVLVDDYAHHPTEIEATLRTAKEVYGRRVVVVFQPHLYSRTRDFSDGFADALGLADVCFLVDIYPAREKPIEGVTSELIARAAADRGLPTMTCVGPKENAVAAVANAIQPGDIVITMGAGSITLIKNDLLRVIKERGLE